MTISIASLCLDQGDFTYILLYFLNLILEIYWQ